MKDRGDQKMNILIYVTRVFILFLKKLQTYCIKVFCTVGITRPILKFLIYDLNIFYFEKSDFCYVYNSYKNKYWDHEVCDQKM